MTRSTTRLAASQGSQGSLTFTSQYGTGNVTSSPIVSVDGAPGDAPERRRPPASPKLHAETAQEIDIFAKSNGWPNRNRRAFSRDTPS
jgi:hypothetical protein